MVAGWSRRSASPRCSTVTGVLARAPGHGTSATLGVVALLVVAAALVVWRRARTAAPGGAAARGCRWRSSSPWSLSIPFAVSGRWGLLGVGFNNDLGLHLAWAEWLRSGFGPAPDAGYPLGPHGLAVATAAVPGIGLGQAFVGEIFAIGVLTGLTALGALRELRRRAARRSPRRWSPSPTSAASYFAQAAFKETAEALFVLAFAIYLTASRRAPPTTARLAAAAAAALPPLALAGGIFFSYSFAGLAWPIAILALWSLTQPAVRRALRPRRAAALPAAAGDAARRSSSSPGWRSPPPWSGPSASPAASTKSPAPTPTARSPRSRRWGSGRPPTTGSTRSAAPS